MQTKLAILAPICRSTAVLLRDLRFRRHASVAVNRSEPLARKSPKIQAFRVSSHAHMPAFDCQDGRLPPIAGS